MGVQAQSEELTTEDEGVLQPLLEQIIKGWRESEVQNFSEQREGGKVDKKVDCWFFNLPIILGDPGEDSWDEVKIETGEKNFNEGRRRNSSYFSSLVFFVEIFCHPFRLFLRPHYLSASGSSRMLSKILETKTKM